eukprot:CAMPEP_0179427402 /NCGR_PEP_ID=MMETSP0799-20121207/13363_1 /TAXON_ID=46947 /ORGANISM="Geminigera cryophila, Strain CCMP2564" /LENGTH=106 /DNA_ID=CAMNT_0021202439 /DNA_START=1268 /DNA_END=1588 /DNA_ORIENTATION=-
MCCSVVQYVAVGCSVDPYEPSPSIAVAGIMRTKGAVDSVYGSTNCNGMNESFCLEGINPNLKLDMSFSSKLLLRRNLQCTMASSSRLVSIIVAGRFAGVMSTSSSV